MEWEQLFLPHILQRGQNYYEEGLVGELEEVEDGFKAVVCGTDDYEVYIYMNQEGIEDMECSCPYADQGNYCKHMAAVLYELEEQHTGDITNRRIIESHESMQDIEQLVMGVDEDSIRKFLIDALANNERLLMKFKTIVCKEISQEEVQSYKVHIDRIFAKHSDRHNYINYYNASSFIDELFVFLNEEMVIAMNKGAYKQAFEVTSYLFIRLGNQDIDDSDGGISIIAEQCMAIWEEILEGCEQIEQKRDMFQWMNRQLDGSVIDYMEDYLLDVLFGYFKEEEFLKQKLEIVEVEVKATEKIDEGWRRNNQLGYWTIKHLEIMKNLNIPESELKAYCKRYWYVSAIRQYSIEEALKVNDKQRAISILKESKELDKSWIGLVTQYSDQLRVLYKENGDEVAYKEELWESILYYKKGNLEIFKELKALYTEEEWEKERERILEEEFGYYLGELYLEEDLYDRLLRSIQASYGLNMLFEYEKHLKELYPMELLNKYELEVRKMAEHTSNRKQYQEMIAILRRMLKYPNAQEYVERIVKDWKYYYKNRRAMMEELNKLRLN